MNIRIALGKNTNSLFMITGTSSSLSSLLVALPFSFVRYCFIEPRIVAVVVVAVIYDAANMFIKWHSSNTWGV